MANPNNPGEKQHYVKVMFEFGTDDNNGHFVPKNTGNVTYVSMPLEDAVLLQERAVIPGFNLMLEKAGELGMESVGLVEPV